METRPGVSMSGGAPGDSACERRCYTRSDLAARVTGCLTGVPGGEDRLGREARSSASRSEIDLAESWKASASAAEADPAGHLLAATSLLAPEERTEGEEAEAAGLKALAAGLDLLLHLFHAERAFVFE